MSLTSEGAVKHMHTHLSLQNCLICRTISKGCAAIVYSLARSAVFESKQPQKSCSVIHHINVLFAPIKHPNLLQFLSPLPFTLWSRMGVYCMTKSGPTFDKLVHDLLPGIEHYAMPDGIYIDY
jgi:hypothetical protein